MELIMVLLGAGLFMSVAGNAYQLYLARTSKKKRKYDLTAQDLVHDLTVRGAAMVRLEVIDPTNLLLRSSRD